MRNYNPQVGQIYRNPKGNRYLVLEFSNTGLVVYRILDVGDGVDPKYIGRVAEIAPHEMSTWGWELENQSTV